MQLPTGFLPRQQHQPISSAGFGALSSVKFGFFPTFDALTSKDTLHILPESPAEIYAKEKLGIRRKVYTLDTSQGPVLAYQYYKGEEPPAPNETKRVYVIFHGLSSRPPWTLAQIARMMEQPGNKDRNAVYISVQMPMISVDSSGTGHVDMEKLTRIARDVISGTSKTYGQKVNAMGLSLGGLILDHLALDPPEGLQSVIGVSPADVLQADRTDLTLYMRFRKLMDGETIKKATDNYYDICARMAENTYQEFSSKTDHPSLQRWYDWMLDASKNYFKFWNDITNRTTDYWTNVWKSAHDGYNDYLNSVIDHKIQPPFPFLQPDEVSDPSQMTELEKLILAEKDQAKDRVRQLGYFSFPEIFRGAEKFTKYAKDVQVKTLKFFSLKDKLVDSKKSIAASLQSPLVKVFEFINGMHDGFNDGKNAQVIAVESDKFVGEREKENGVA